MRSLQLLSAGCYCRGMASTRKLRLRSLERHELKWLLTGLAICICIWAFWAFASEVREGDTQAFDVKVVQALRNPSDARQSIGPQWVQLAMVDVTALGGWTVLTLVIAIVVGFLALQGRSHTALLVMGTALGGELLSYVLKHTFNRPRPSVVPNLRIMSPSFPSGHAMESAVVYLTLGAMLMRIADRRVTKIYCLGVAVFLTTLIGISRVYLGVHYPTDVVAGWFVGFFWASICWLVAQRIESTAGIAEERDKAG
jgi:undecaprenyl-diphosphatase